MCYNERNSTFDVLSLFPQNPFKIVNAVTQIYDT